MSDLVVEVDVIERMRGDLGRIRREFENANQNSESTAEAVGHPGLAEHVRNFAHNWDNRRRDLVEQIETIEGQLDNLQEQFDVTDRELASGLGGAS
jgi:hypothetical protein